jgi:hypothetical protein
MFSQDFVSGKKWELKTLQLISWQTYGRTDGRTHARTYKHTRTITYTRYAIARALKIGQQRYFSRIYGGATPKGGELKLGTFVEPLYLINHTNFYLFLMNSFRGRGVKNEDLPLKGIWLLQHCLTLPRWHVIQLQFNGCNLSPWHILDSIVKFELWSAFYEGIGKQQHSGFADQDNSFWTAVCLSGRCVINKSTKSIIVMPSFTSLNCIQRPGLTHFSVRKPLSLTTSGRDRCSWPKIVPGPQISRLYPVWSASVPIFI